MGAMPVPGDETLRSAVYKKEVALRWLRYGVPRLRRNAT